MVVGLEMKERTVCAGEKKEGALEVPELYCHKLFQMIKQSLLQQRRLTLTVKASHVPLDYAAHTIKCLNVFNPKVFDGSE